MKNIIGVRFKKLGKIYFFNPKYIHVRKGDKVIVETSQGEEIGEVVIPNRYVNDEKILEPLKKVIRIASYKDCKRYDECKKIEKVLRKNNISYFEKWKFHTGLFHVISSRKNSKCDIYIHSDSIERAKQALGIQTTK